MDKELSELEDTIKSQGTRFQIMKQIYTDNPHIVNMLEIGVHYGFMFKSMRPLLNKRDGIYSGVDVRDKVIFSIDHPHTFYQMSSAAFWGSFSREIEWDLIFVDGGHSSECAKLDVSNALEHVALGGYILIHDIANEKFEEDGPRRAFYDLCMGREGFKCALVWHKRGWMGIVHREG